MGNEFWCIASQCFLATAKKICPCICDHDDTPDVSLNGGGSASQDHPVSHQTSSEDSARDNPDRIPTKADGHNVAGLMTHISQLWNRISQSESPLEYWSDRDSRDLYNFLSSGKLPPGSSIPTAGKEDVSHLDDITDAVSMVKTFVEAIGKSSLATAGFLLIAYGLERFQDVSANKEECRHIMEEMDFLAKVVLQCEDRSSLSKELREEIKKARELIIKGAVNYYSQIKSGPFSRFCKAKGMKEQLVNIKDELHNAYVHFYLQIGICIYDAGSCKKRRLSREYPKHAVGIEKSVKEVTDLLEWGTEKNAVAVILYSFGGMGKTTLADAVFSRVDIKQVDRKDCKYSQVELFKSIESSPNIIQLQTKILEDLMGKENIPEIRKYQDGQQQIGLQLEKVPAFIYIDNVLEKDKLRQLLPLNFDKAKKVRLLITARDINVRKVCRMTTPPKGYLMRGISSAYAKSLLEEQLPKSLLANEMPSNKEGILNSNQFNRIIDKCGGIPLMLNLVVEELSSSKHEKEVCDVIEELEKLEGEEFGVKVEYCFFIYDKLPKECKETFLDICAFFQGWDWDLVADMVGKAALERLERRALVAKGPNGIVTVHAVILEVGRRMAKAMRIRFLERSELQNFLQEDEKLVEELRYLRYKPAKDLNQLIKNNLKLPQNLKYMEIDGNLHCDDLEFFPASLLRLPDLRILRLINFQGLKELPSVLGHLVKGLHELTLSNCNSFKELPYSFSKLTSLRVLKMDHCQSLTQLPKDFGTFEEHSSLRELNLSHCKVLEHLPVGLGKMTSLVRLDVSHCKSLVGIPESIGKLKSLLSMDISWCSSLKKLSNEFCSLSITSLKLTRCTALEELPNGFGQLESLRVLKLKSCTLLKKLPEGFSKLRCLVHLDLSGCIGLQELCINFSDLLSLRTLTLDGCKNLRKLPENLDRLDSLQHLNLSNCELLEGESMDNVVKAKVLERVYIRNSDKLKEKWRKIQGMPDQLWPFNVDIGQELRQEEKESEWEKLSSAFGRLLQNRQGNPYHISKWSPNTILLVLFDGRPDFTQEFPSPLIEETIDDVRINFEILYIGKHFNKLPKTVADRISGRALDNTDARLLLEKLFFTLKMNDENLWHKKMNKSFSMSTKIMGKRNREVGSVKENDDNYYLSCWTLLSDLQMEEFVLDKCGRFLWLKQLAAKKQENSIRFLTELFVYMGKDYCLLRKSDKVGLDELRRKTILLEIRPANAIYDSRLQSLENLYITEKEKERSNLEIISIPIGQMSIKFEQFSGNIPWLVLQNAWTITTAAEKYFLIKALLWEDRDGEWYPSRFMKIEPNKEVAHIPVLSMLERWGPNVYPFSDEKIKELREEEWNQRKSMSSLKFILKPLMGELDQMKEVMLNRKMICLVCDGNHPRTKRVRTKTFEECIMSAMKEVIDSIQFIYVHPPYKKTETTVTDTVKVQYFPLEDSKKKESKLPYSLILPPWAAMRLSMRVGDLRKEIDALDENDEQLQGMKKLLDSLDTGYSSMAIMDEDGEVFTTQGIQIVDIFEDRKEKAKGDAKELVKRQRQEDSLVGARDKKQQDRKRVRGMIKLMIKGSKEERKEALLELLELLESQSPDLDVLEELS